MVKVLRDWREIGEANLAMSRARLSRHVSCEKTWDLYRLYELVRTAPRESRVVDLGCAGLCALKMLRTMGFSRLAGIDLSISWRDRVSQVWSMWKRRTLTPPFRLRRADITRTGFANGAFDIAVSISTVEHGVDLALFVREAARILRPGGILFVTTDYWSEGVSVEGDFRPYGLPWHVFDQKQISDMIALADQYGLKLLEPRAREMECGDRCVAWSGCEYTFICLAFRKRTSSAA
jgi:SAM-dependent methyltransferase